MAFYLGLSRCFLLGYLFSPGKHLIFHKGFLTEPGLECTGGCHWSWEWVEERKCKEITQSIENSVGSAKWTFLFSVEPPCSVMAAWLSPEFYPFKIHRGGFQTLFLKCQLRDTKLPSLNPSKSEVSYCLKHENLTNFNLEWKFIGLHKQWKVETPE